MVADMVKYEIFVKIPFYNFSLKFETLVNISVTGVPLLSVIFYFFIFFRFYKTIGIKLYESFNNNEVSGILEIIFLYRRR
jgi:hypothetical protein